MTRVLVIKHDIPTLSSHLHELYQFLVERCKDGGNVTIKEIMHYQNLRSPAPVISRLEHLADRGLIRYT